MQTYHDRKAHLAITVDRTYQTGHTAASQKQRLNNSAVLKDSRFPGVRCMCCIAAKRAPGMAKKGDCCFSEILLT